MSEIRYDPIRRTWVAISTRRDLRPDHFVTTGPFDPAGKPETCPFCPGREGMTPPEIMSLREEEDTADEPGWRIRVVPNKYPAFSEDVPFPLVERGLHRTAPGFGLHEIVVETPDHNLQIPDLPVAVLTDVLGVFRRRIRNLKEDGRYRTVIVFKNHGRDAGASLPHSHSQIIGLPLVPEGVRRELEAFRERYENTSRCLMCAMMDQERIEGDRVILEREGVLAFAPYASGFPFQIRVVHGNHEADFAHADDDDLRSFASVLREALCRLRDALDDPPYNLILNSVPFPDPGEGDDRETWGDTAQYYHWYVDIVPRLTRMAGFELKTGIMINPTAPEEGAEMLRNIKV